MASKLGSTGMDGEAFTSTTSFRDSLPASADEEILPRFPVEAQVEERPYVARSTHLFVLGACVLLVVASHGMTLGYGKFANVDEAYAAALGKRLLDGKLLYDGAVSQRGPLMYLSFEVLGRWFGWDNVYAIRGASLAFTLAHLAILHWTAKKLFSRDIAILATAIVTYALTVGMPAFDGIALNGETLLIPILLVGVTLGAQALRAPMGSSGRTVTIVLAGLCFGAAASYKQTTIPHFAPLLLWIIADALDRRRWKQGLLDGFALLVSTLAVPVSFAIQAYRHGILRQFVYYTYTYNVQIHTRGVLQDRRYARFFHAIIDYPMFTGLVFIAMGAVVAIWGSRCRRALKARSIVAAFTDMGVKEYVALHAALSFAVAISVPQLYPHYFIVPLPFLALMVAYRVGAAISHEDSRLPTQWTLISIAALAFPMGISMMYLREKVDGRVTHDESVEWVSSYIKKHTKPSDSIFVWGFSPWLYGYSHRAPAGRFLFATYLTGFVPWFWDGLDDEPRRVVPGAMEALLSDLDQEKPVMVIDAGSVEISRSMRAYPMASEWLHKHYCFNTRVGVYDIYTRKPFEGGCVPDYFPYPAPSIDYFGVPLVVPTPAPVDFPQSRFLPVGMRDIPVRFVPKATCEPRLPVTFGRVVTDPPDMSTYGFERNLDPEDPYEANTP